MEDHSQEEQALTKIQHEWAEARIKGDSSYTRSIEADDCTIVWPDGSIGNKRARSANHDGHQVLRIQDPEPASASLWRHGYRRRRGRHQSAQGETRSYRWEIRLDRHVCEAGRSVEGGRFSNHSGLGKVITLS